MNVGIGHAGAACAHGKNLMCACWGRRWDIFIDLEASSPSDCIYRVMLGGEMDLFIDLEL